MSAALDQMAARLQTAFDSHDLASFGSLLADDVWWGDDEHPHRCCGRTDVLATFGRLVGHGIDTKMTSIVVGRRGILAVMGARWSDGGTETTLFHAYHVDRGLVTHINRYEDRDTALLAIRA